MNNERFSKRLAAVEAKAAPRTDSGIAVLFQPQGLDPTGLAAWRAEHVAPLEAQGVRPLVVNFVAVGDPL